MNTSQNTTTDKPLKVRCVNAHDRCNGGAPCPYCEPVVPLRHVDGTFAARHIPWTQDGFTSG